MLIKNQIGHIRAQRDVLSSLNNKWIVELKCSFQVKCIFIEKNILKFI